VARLVIDDHLLRDVLVGDRPTDLGGLAAGGIATTGLWLFRLCSALAEPPEIDVLPMRDLAWLMAELQTRHRAEGGTLSAAMVEALAAARRHGGGIAVSRHDVGPNLRAAAQTDQIPFHVL